MNSIFYEGVPHRETVCLRQGLSEWQMADGWPDGSCQSTFSVENHGESWRLKGLLTTMNPYLSLSMLMFPGRGVALGSELPFDFHKDSCKFELDPKSSSKQSTFAFNKNGIGDGSSDS